MPTCPLEVNFSKIIQIFLVNFGDHRESAPSGAGQDVKIHAKTCWNPRDASDCVAFDRFMASELVKQWFPDGFENSKKVLKKRVF